MSNKPRICIITYPRPSASITPLSNLVRILAELSGFLYLITGNEGEHVLKANRNLSGYFVKYKRRSFIATRIISHIILQMKIAFNILQVNMKIDLYVFYMGEGLLLPMLICKLARKPVLLALAGSLARISEDGGNLSSKPFVLMEEANYLLADKIIIYSKKLIQEWSLGKYKNKISIAHEHHIDFSEFHIIKEPEKSRTIVSYIGRLSEEKGAFNFIKAIPQIGTKNGISFLVGGDGKLRNKIEGYLDEKGLLGKVQLCGWISHDKLPGYLNETKLIVLPSNTEGLPNIMLEAMACGTPVLATPVGAIPDIINDGVTGFIMENNSPDCISENIIRALNHPDLDQITRNAQTMVKETFTYQKTVERYGEVLSEIWKKHGD